MKNITYDQLIGALYGVALGDALGMPYEFAYGRKPYADAIVANGSQTLGQVSDDTEMSLALLHAIKENNGWNREKVIDAYGQWADSDVPDIGRTTGALFCGYGSVEKKRKSYEATYNLMYVGSQIQSWSQSNGCLMRCVPLLLCPRNEQRWLDDCHLTNPHPICMEACTFYFKMLYEIIDGTHAPLTIAWSQTPQIRECIEDALSVKSLLEPGRRNVSKMRGWALHGLYFAMVMYYAKPQTFEDAMRFVIGCHLDSDTDTNACIAGGLLGCMLGHAKMLESRQTKENLALLLSAKSNRPFVYHPCSI
jgi:ADP-ribosyl-[dinitrogen reductase] hydrolase